jgi:hypothetical protein
VRVQLWIKVEKRLIYRNKKTYIMKGIQILKIVGVILIALLGFAVLTSCTEEVTPDPILNEGQYSGQYGYDEDFYVTFDIHYNGDCMALSNERFCNNYFVMTEVFSGNWLSAANFTVEPVGNKIQMSDEGFEFSGTFNGNTIHGIISLYGDEGRKYEVTLYRTGDCVKH